MWPFKQRQDTLTDDAIFPWVSAFWTSLEDGTAAAQAVWSPRLIDRVWVAHRCMQLTCNQIAEMTLRFHGPRQPQWVGDPDPAWYPGGIKEAIHALTWHMYGYGDAFLYITSRYATGFPSAWTLLDPASMNVQIERGRRVYRSGDVPLDPDDVVQISLDPRGRLRGTGALEPYAPLLWGMLAAAELGRTVVGAGGSVPNAVLKSKRKLTADQAQALQEQWVAARIRASTGAPAILPPDLEFETLAFNPADMLLIDVQQHNARAIASAFGIPPFMINMPLEGGLTYQSPQMLFDTWVRDELRPIAGRIAETMSNRLLPAGQYVEFDDTKVTAPTFQDEVDSWLKLLGGGVVTVDEVRVKVPGLPPLAEGEALDELSDPPTIGVSAAQNTETTTVQELRPAVTA